MTVELKKGYIIDSYYDKNTRSYITTLKDNEGNQIRDAYYSGNMTDRNADVQHLKEFFYEYMNEALDLKKSIKDTKEKTKKSKLPALSTLSPIMPDAAAGIDTFNSGVGLSEEWIHRDELESKLKKMGFKYNFARYTDEQLYRIYQERLKYLEKKHKEKEKKKQQENEAENKRINSKDSFMKNGIEFESEDAAKEYFGESMNNKFYLNDMLASYDIEDNEIKQSLNENLNTKNNFRTITEGLKYFEIKEFDKTGKDTELEALYEGIRGDLSSSDIQKLSNFLRRASNADEVNTYIKGLLSEDLNDEGFDIYKLSEDILNYANSEWGVWNTDIYDIDRDNNKISFYVKGDWKHDHWAFDDAVEEYLKDNYPSIDFTTYKYELDDEDEYDSDSYPGVHVVKLLLNSSSLTEARKPKYVDSMFGKRVKDAMDKGELTYHNIKEWDRKENDGRDPIPPFNTRELMNFYSAHPDYFNESLHEAFDGSIENLNVEEIVPQQKDYDRAKGLKFRGHSFRGNGEPFGSEASKMAKLIKDPIKLVRRAKAVVATYGADNGYISNTGYYHHVAPDADTDVWGPFRKRLKEFGFTRDQINSIENFNPKLSESLNESYYVREWWGQVDENPFEVAARYDLDIKAIKNHLDSTLYEFIGDLEDLNKAKHDGYFYDSKISEIKGDIPILKELVESLNQVGFILDESATNKGLTNIRGQDWHLQVINPKMFYPTSETEGENITEDEAYRLFRDDLREVEGILDEIEEKYPYVFITFNFGPNKNNVITGGIDMRIRNE